MRYFEHEARTPWLGAPRHLRDPVRATSRLVSFIRINNARSDAEPHTIDQPVRLGSLGWWASGCNCIVQGPPFGQNTCDEFKAQSTKNQSNRSRR